MRKNCILITDPIATAPSTDLIQVRFLFGRLGKTAAISLLIFGSVYPRVQERSDYLAVKNRYSNYDYAYSVRIPKQMTALRSRPPFPNHGFIIQLSNHPKASLSVDASYNAIEWSSFDDAISFHKDSFEHDVGGEVTVVAQVPTTLGGLRAIRFTLKRTTSTPNDREVREVLLAFRKGAGEVGIVYEITLSTQTSRYQKDKHLIDDLQRTWRLKPLPK